MVPLLPAEIGAKVLAEHRRIEAAGSQAADVRAHARWEEATLRPHVPPRIWAELLRQHQRVDHPVSLGASTGLMRSRTGAAMGLALVLGLLAWRVAR